MFDIEHDNYYFDLDLSKVILMKYYKFGQYYLRNNNWTLQLLAVIELYLVK